VNGVQIGYMASARFFLTAGEDSKLSCQEHYLESNRFELKFPDGSLRRWNLIMKLVDGCRNNFSLFSE
jgi:hypothetical protein